MSIPILFVHTGDPYYLKYSLRQAKLFNPDSTIYLLGDESNNKYPFVTHININDYQAASQNFAAVYKHLSSNIYGYELFCFQRWFIIRDFLKANRLEAFVYLDSDVLAYTEFLPLISQFDDCEIANTGKGIGMPAFSYFNSYNSIDKFCSYLLNYYTNKDLLSTLNAWYDRFLQQPIHIGGICDMTIFDFYFKNNTELSKKIDIVGDLCFDANIAYTVGFESLKGLKKLYWKKGLPYCKSLDSGQLLQFATIHYQGEAKRIMIKDYKAGGYSVQKHKDRFDIFKNENIIKSKRFIKKMIGRTN